MVGFSLSQSCWMIQLTPPGKPPIADIHNSHNIILVPTRRNNILIINIVVLQTLIARWAFRLLIYKVNKHRPQQPILQKPRMMPNEYTGLLFIILRNTWQVFELIACLSREAFRIISMVCAYGIDNSKYLFLEALSIIWMVFAFGINRSICLSLEALSIIVIAYGFETINVWFRYSYGLSVMSAVSADGSFWPSHNEGWRILVYREQSDSLYRIGRRWRWRWSGKCKVETTYCIRLI